MTNIQSLTAIIMSMSAVVILITTLFSNLRRTEAKGITAALNNVAELVAPLLGKSKASDVAAKIISYATVGTNMAEQLYKIGELPKDERNEAAINYVTDALQIAGVEITPEVERLTEGAIEAAVHTMNSASGILLATEVETVVEVEEEADSA